VIDPMFYLATEDVAAKNFAEAVASII
jgi:hypothetical protein